MLRRLGQFPLPAKASARPLRPLVVTRSITSREYSKLADETLEDLLFGYEAISERIPEVEADLSNGVLTLNVPNTGTYVINKMPPNQQIWLSSPLSGPKRYEYLGGKWYYPRDESTLGALLKQEALETLNQELSIETE